MELHIVGADRPALVDDCWADLARYRWRLDRDGYVCRRAKGKRIYLHHVVMPGNRYPVFVRDHVNRDKLDNRDANLRWVTRAENNQNCGARLKNPTGHRGVMRIGRRYRATATLNGVVHRLGMFDDPDEAGAATSAWRRNHMPSSADARAEA